MLTALVKKVMFKKLNLLDIPIASVLKFTLKPLEESNKYKFFNVHRFYDFQTCRVIVVVVLPIVNIFKQLFCVTFKFSSTSPYLFNCIICVLLLSSLMTLTVEVY